MGADCIMEDLAILNNECGELTDIFYFFFKEIYPGQFEPSPCHQFIRYLEDHGKLLRNYTQNIDTLERVAGINQVVECHGSFATASCIQCKYQVDCSVIKEDVFNQASFNLIKCKCRNYWCGLDSKLLVF